jgi:hypothetical protein
MRRSVTLIVLAAPLAWGSVAQAVDAPTLMRKCQQVRFDRWDGVTHYVVDQSTMGNRVTLGYERFEAPGPDGKPQPAFRPATAEGPMSSSDLRTFSAATREVGDGLSREMKNAGFPSSLLGSAGQDPWVSTDPSVMMGAQADFLSSAADAQDAQRAEREASVREASKNAAEVAELSRRLHVVGPATVDGHAVHHLRADQLQRRFTGDDGSVMVVDTIELWVDERECVPRKLEMKGTVTSEGQTRPMTIERRDGDYRKVPGSKMYEPFRQVMSMKGAMTAEQERELRDAQVELQKMEKQLAEMPPAQRQMIEQQMGPQLQMMKRMAAGGGLEIVTEVHAIVVNPDPAALQALQTSSSGSTAIAAATAMPAASAAPAAPAAAAAPDVSAQKACIEAKAQQKQEAQRKQQGMGRLMGAVGRAASRLGGDAFTRAISDMQLGKATADDVAAAARDLGLTEDEIAACQNAG